MNHASFKKPLVVALASLAMGATAIQAQELEEVVVTAQKRAQSLQDVPVSINALTGDKLSEANLTKLEDVTSYVPNLSMSETGIGTQIFIRGIGSGINQAFEQSVGTYIDGVYYGRAQLSRAPFMDMERLEVLRGPQGILFGKNSIAGALNMSTAKPTDELELKAGILYEPRFNQQEVNLVASGPLTDTVRARLAVRGYNDDGYIENTLLDRDEPQREERAIRGTLAWDVTDNFDVTLKAERDTFDVKGRQIEIVMEQPNPLNGATYSQMLYSLTGNAALLDGEQDYKRQADSPEFSDNTVDNLTLTMNYDMGFATLTSVTGSVRYKFSENCDCDFTGGDIFNIESTEEYRQLSQELRLVSPGGETIDWIAGVFYQDNELNYDEDTFFSENSLLGVISPLDLVQGTNVTRTYEQNSTAAAIFGQLTWNISEAWALTLGGRYTEESKDGSRVMDIYNTATGMPDPVAAQVVKGAFNVDTESFTGHNLAGDRDESAFTPSVNLQYILNDDVMFYASYATGYKSGGYDTRANQNDAFEFDREEATTYEVGAKTRFLDNSAELNAAVFFTDYQDLQTSQFDGKLGFVVGNAKKAEVKGFELDGRFALPYNLMWTAALGYLDFEYKDFQDGNCYYGEPTSDPDGILCDYTGKPSQYTPKWSGSTSLEHHYDFSSGLSLRTTVDLTYQGKQFIHPNLDPNWEYTPGYKVNGRIALEDDNWTLALVGKNLTDKDTLTYANTAPLSTTFGAQAFYGFVERPRTIALQADYRY